MGGLTWSLNNGGHLKSEIGNLKFEIGVAKPRRDAFSYAPPARRGRRADQENATLPLDRREAGEVIHLKIRQVYDAI